MCDLVLDLVLEMQRIHMVTNTLRENAMINVMEMAISMPGKKFAFRTSGNTPGIA